jgi:hypothetical protein
VSPDLSSPRPGGYGAAGAAQLDRVARAAALDRSAALRAASWGRFQIMGFNAVLCGYPDVETFVAGMADDEGAQLDAFVAFVRSMRLDAALRAQDWAEFARGYNGLGYRRNRYVEKLASAYRRHAGAPSAEVPREGARDERARASARAPRAGPTVLCHGQMAPVRGDIAPREGQRFLPAQTREEQKPAPSLVDRVPETVHRLAPGDQIVDDGELGLLAEPLVRKGRDLRKLVCPTRVVPDRAEGPERVIGAHGRRRRLPVTLRDHPAGDLTQPVPEMASDMGPHVRLALLGAKLGPREIRLHRSSRRGAPAW